MDITLPRTPAHIAKHPWYAVLRSPLWLCLLAGLLIRVWLSVRTHGALDGDEALLGIQAEHILQGERPIYFYGLSYFGSLEAYIVAAVSAVFGPSVGVLRAVTTVFGLALIALTWWFAGLLALAARLPLYARKRFTLCAALVAAVLPVYDGIIELRTGGGWPESFCIMLLLLILAFRLTTRWHEGATKGEMALRWAGIGFVVGFGMWVYPLVTVAILAAAVWIVGDRVVAAVQRMRAAIPPIPAIWPPLNDLLLALVALPTAALGFTPGIIWGASNQWANITYLFSLSSSSSTAQRVIRVANVSVRYGVCVAPRVISGATPGESLALTVIHTPLLLVGVGAIGFSFAAIAASFRWSHPALARARRLATLPALFGVSSGLLFCVSAASASILHGCQNDLGGRYASPLALAMPFLIATAFTVISVVIAEQAPPREAGSVTGALAALRALGTPGQRKRALALLAVFALLAVYLGGQLSTYALTDADEAFESAYCTIAPARYKPIIAYLEQQQVKYVWATNLLAYPISFKTNSRIIVADPLAVIHPGVAINRIPSYTNAVAQADRPTFLVFVNHGDPYPYALQVLDQMSVTYNVAFFPSQPGVDVMAVTPLNQNVSPLTTPALDIFYCQIINGAADIPA